MVEVDEVKTNIDWNKALWGKLSNEEILSRLEKLPDELQGKIFEGFRFGHDELLALGWWEICLGCGGPSQKCDCPCGSGWAPPQDALKQTSE